MYFSFAQAFPETLFHQLLPAMVHPDHETRVGAHRIFSVVLVPTSVFPRPYSSMPETKKGLDFPRTLSRTVSVFSSSAALFEKLKKEKFPSLENVFQGNQENFVCNGEPRNTNNGVMSRLMSSYSRSYSIEGPPGPSAADGDYIYNSTKEPVSVNDYYC